MRARGQPAADTYVGSFWRGSRSFVVFLTQRHGRLPRASEVTADDTASWLRERRKTAPFYPYYLRGQLHAAFAWGLKQRHNWTGEGRDYGLTHNPIASVPAGQKEPACDRVQASLINRAMAERRAFDLGETLHTAESTGPNWKPAIAKATKSLDDEAKAALEAARTAYASTA